jgi:hypothetical protein
VDVFAKDRGPSARGAAEMGTRFRVFPQPPFVLGYEEPETIRIAAQGGPITAGPADLRMYVVDPIIPKAPYAFPFLPPYRGVVHPPAEPGPDGHFDHHPIGSRAFLHSHLFACVRRVWDTCEGFFGAPIPWFFAQTYDRLELVPWLFWKNAHSGYGFLEMGEDDTGHEPFPFALNFDAVAHEAAHLAGHGVLGIPKFGQPDPDYLAFHEASADLISLLSLLTFDRALDNILWRTRGNLLLVNELDRFAELGNERQVRALSHSLKQHDVGGEVHDRARPLAGALFDTLVEIFHLLLVERGLSEFDIGEIEDLRTELSPSEIERELSVTRAEYEPRHFALKSALEEARDLLGEVVVRSWTLLSPDGLTLREAAEALVATAQGSRARDFTGRLGVNLAWRELL